MMRTVNILSLGAGVQSSTLYIMFYDEEFPEKLDAAIFADTQEEPGEVYSHLGYLANNFKYGAPILMDTAGKLGNDLISGTNSIKQRFVSIPAFTKNEDGSISIIRRQCSIEYKTEVIYKVLRRDVLGLKARQRVPSGVAVNMFIGISLDEAGRAHRLMRRKNHPKYINLRFPLIERNMTRQDCIAYLAKQLPYEVPRSACTFCPYHSDYEWDKLKRTDQVGWKRAVEVDDGIRNNPRLRQQTFLHRSCVPLAEVVFDPKPPKSRSVQLAMNFTEECEGVCGV